MAADTRDCEQCGITFAPRREHARFCSAPCRTAWNREHLSDPAAGLSALRWSITAMSDTTGRLPRVKAANLPRAFAVIGEAVWWVTIVDATLVRHHPESYDAVLAAQSAPRQRLIEGTLAGLRFVRNRTGDEADLADFIDPSMAGASLGEVRITGWRWRSVPVPGLASLPPRGQAWELTRYRAYQAHLSGHNIAERFGLAAGFLKLASAATPRITGIGARVIR